MIGFDRALHVLITRFISATSCMYLRLRTFRSQNIDYKSLDSCCLNDVDLEELFVLIWSKIRLQKMTCRISS